MKTKEELNALKEGGVTLSKQHSELTEEVLAQVSDIESLRTSGKTVLLPEARSKKESDGGYAGNTVPDLPKV